MHKIPDYVKVQAVDHTNRGTLIFFRSVDAAIAHAKKNSEPVRHTRREVAKTANGPRLMNVVYNESPFQYRARSARPGFFNSWLSVGKFITLYGKKVK